MLTFLVTIKKSREVALWSGSLSKREDGRLDDLFQDNKLGQQTSVSTFLLKLQTLLENLMPITCMKKILFEIT